MGLKTPAFGAIFIVHVMSMFLSGGMAGSAAQHFHLGFFFGKFTSTFEVTLLQ